MRSSLLLPLAASATASLLERLTAPAPTAPPALAARATGDNDAAQCLSALETILPRLTGAPVPDPTLLPLIAEQEWVTATTELCELPEVTGDPSLVAGWSSYMSEVQSFYADHMDDISSLAAACTAADPGVTGQLPYVPGECGAGGGGGGGNRGNGGSGSGSGDGNGDSEGDDNESGDREGGNGGGNNESQGGNGNGNADNGSSGSKTRGEAMVGAAVALAGLMAMGIL